MDESSETLCKLIRPTNSNHDGLKGLIKVPPVHDLKVRLL